MAEKEKQRRLSGQSQQDAAKLVMDGGRKCSEVAAEYGVSEGSVYAWVRRARQGELLSANSDSSPAELRGEITRLRRELKEARDHALFLRKTAAFFASEKK